MIKKLQNSNIEVSEKIRSVFQLSYKIESELLNAIDFPPLKRSLINYVNSPTAFFGFLKYEALVGVIEIEHNSNITDINSLVVHPDFFRQGIARQLIEYVFNTFDSNIFIVETGMENLPARALYEKFNFKEIKQWNTDHGVRKIKLERRI